MNRLEEQRDSYPLAAQPAGVFSMPRGFYTSIDRNSPWLSCDPFLRAELRALYRSVRFTLLALFAMLTNSRPSGGASPQGSAVRWSQAPDRATQTQCEDSVEVRQRGQRSEQRRALHSLHTNSRRAYSAPIPRTWDAPVINLIELQVQRAHAPPTGRSQIALFDLTTIAFRISHSSHRAHAPPLRSHTDQRLFSRRSGNAPRQRVSIRASAHSHQPAAVSKTNSPNTSVLDGSQWWRLGGHSLRRPSTDSPSPPELPPRCALAVRKAY